MKPSRPIKLLGKRVNLCPLDEKDLPLFHSWVSDLSITKTTSQSPDIFTLEGEKQWLKQIKKQKNECVLAIVAKKTGKTIGNIGLRNIDKTHRSARLGIIIGDKHYWGKGYGREVIALMLNFAFNVLNLHSINLSVFAYNERALRSYKAVGFKECGRQREAHFWGGKYYDIIKMDILAQEFKNSRIKDLILESPKA